MRMIVIGILAVVAACAETTDKQEFGNWEGVTNTDVMTDKVVSKLLLPGKQLGGSSQGTNAALFVIECHGVLVYLGHLNPVETEYELDGTYKSFSVRFRLDSEPPVSYKVWMRSGKSFLMLAEATGIPSAAASRKLVNDLSGKTRMLFQLEQFRGIETYEFDVSNYGAARAWLLDKCHPGKPDVPPAPGTK